jgi:hypothetical protein
MTTLTPTPKQQFVDANGVPLSGGKVYTYTAGTTTPLATYTDSSGTVPNTNPVILDSRGEASIWIGAASYKFKLTTSTDVEIWTVDNVQSDSLNILPSLAASGGSALIGYLPAGINALPTTVQTELRRTIFADNFSTIQAAIDATPAGGELIFSDQVYSFSTTLNVTKSITFKGKAGRQDYDNSWDLAGGTVLHYTGTTGDAINVNAGAVGNVRLRFVARDIVIRGAKVSPGGATTGNGLHIQANTNTTAVHTYFDNVSVCECAENGVFMEGAIYGSYSNSLSVFDNGKNGLRVIGGTDPIGEMVWIQTRAFANGFSGTGAFQHGIYYQPNGRSNSFVGLSCSENSGYGAHFCAGGFGGNSWQFESNQGSSQLYLGSAGGGASITSLTAKELSFSPVAGYTGKIINVTSDANNVVLNGVFFGDTLGVGGEDVRVDGQKFSISGLSGTHAFTPVVTVNDAFIEGAVPCTNKLLPAFNSKVSTDILNVTGDGTGYTIVFDQDIFDNSNSHNTTTGVFTAPHTGLYLFTYVVSLGGLLAGHDRGLLQLALTSDSITYRIAPAQVMNALNVASFTGAHLVKMNKNDTCAVLVQVDNSTKVVDVLGGFSWFSGHMVAGA